MNDDKILYYLNDNLKTDYIRIMIKEAICNSLSHKLSSDWMFANGSAYKEDKPNEYLDLIQSEVNKLQNHYYFSEKLATIKLDRLHDLYDLNISDKDVFEAIHGMEWDLSNDDEISDNDIVQDIITKYQ